MNYFQKQVIHKEYIYEKSHELYFMIEICNLISNSKYLWFPRKKSQKKYTVTFRSIENTIQARVRNQDFTWTISVHFFDHDFFSMFFSRNIYNFFDCSNVGEGCLWITFPNIHILNSMMLAKKGSCKIICMLVNYVDENFSKLESLNQLGKFLERVKVMLVT